MRHTRLTYLYNNLPEQIVKKYAGHSKSSKMPEIYSHISSKDVRDLMLKEIYGVKELSPEQKNKLEQDLAILKKQFVNYVEENKPGSLNALLSSFVEAYIKVASLYSEAKCPQIYLNAH